MNEIYLVCGESGSRSNEDYNDWVVCAYESAELAAQHVAKAQARANRLYRANRLWVDLRMHGNHDKTTWLNAWGGPRPNANPYDPGMIFNNYDRVRYSAHSVNFLTDVRKLKV